MSEKVISDDLELELAQASCAMHASLNKRVAEALGQPRWASWHDLPEKVALLRKQMCTAKWLLDVALDVGETNLDRDTHAVYCSVSAAWVSACEKFLEFGVLIDDASEVCSKDGPVIPSDRGEE